MFNKTASFDKNGNNRISSIEVYNEPQPVKNPPPPPNSIYRTWKIISTIIIFGSYCLLKLKLFLKSSRLGIAAQSGAHVSARSRVLAQHRHNRHPRNAQLLSKWVHFFFFALSMTLLITILLSLSDDRMGCEQSVYDN